MHVLKCDTCEKNMQCYMWALGKSDTVKKWPGSSFYLWKLGEQGSVYSFPELSPHVSSFVFSPWNMSPQCPSVTPGMASILGCSDKRHDSVDSQSVHPQLPELLCSESTQRCPRLGWDPGPILTQPTPKLQ